MKYCRYYLKDVSRDQIDIGQVAAEPDSISSVKEFATNINILTEKECGKSISITSNSKTNLYFRTKDVNGTVSLSSDLSNIKNWDSASASIKLDYSMAIEIGTEFSIRENGTVIGNGTVTSITSNQ